MPFGSTASPSIWHNWFPGAPPGGVFHESRPMRYAASIGASNLAAYRLPMMQWRRVWSSAARRLAPLDSDARRRLCVIVEEYISGQQFEESAEPATDALKRIAALQSPATALWAALQVAPAGKEALHAAERLINENLFGAANFLYARHTPAIRQRARGFCHAWRNRDGYQFRLACWRILWASL